MSTPRSPSDLIERQHDPLILGTYHARLMGYFYFLYREDGILYFYFSLGIDVQLSWMRIISIVWHRQKLAGITDDIGLGPALQASSRTACNFKDVPLTRSIIVPQGTTHT